MPRVLLVCDFHVKYATRLADGLLTAGAEVMLITHAHAGEFGGDLSRQRADTVDRLAGRAEVRFLPGRASDPSTAPAVARLRREVGHFGPDVVQVQERLMNDPRLPLVAPLRRGGYALTVHDPTPHPGEDRSDALRRWADARLLRRAGLVFVHAEALRDELREVSRPSAPVEVVPHGADPPRARPLPSDPTLLLFGRLSFYKGLDVLLDAMPVVWERVPAARLVIAGQGPLPEHPLLGDGRIELRHEHVPEDALDELFARSTCVVLPYRQASQSGVGSQAKTYGRASVVTALGGLPELVADGSGLVVPPEDPAALAEALVRVLSEPALAERLGRQAADGLAASASWPRVGELTLDALRRHGLI